ncbi:hypothetical protein [Janthinobacterium sp. CG3]|uniref:hypothetical protein n=1 Tax=Janthinobacterium sp. CG3 TaxID=1075768 RepID=UPI00056D76B2|nr:hypothetical protein [Janthinobacterium sp. CG3]
MSAGIKKWQDRLKVHFSDEVIAQLQYNNPTMQAEINDLRTALAELVRKVAAWERLFDKALTSSPP